MSKLLIVTFMALAAIAADAQSRRSTTRRGAVGADGGAAVAKGKDARVIISRKAQLKKAHQAIRRKPFNPVPTGKALFGRASLF